MAKNTLKTVISVRDAATLFFINLCALFCFSSLFIHHLFLFHVCIFPFLSLFSFSSHSIILAFSFFCLFVFVFFLLIIILMLSIYNNIIIYNILISFVCVCVYTRARAHTHGKDSVRQGTKKGSAFNTPFYQNIYIKYKIQSYLCARRSPLLKGRFFAALRHLSQ